MGKSLSRCNICPFRCALRYGEVGKCGVIVNAFWKKQGWPDWSDKPGPFLPLWESKYSHVGVEAIEKRPFFHFDPGSSYLSVGLFGCSMSCGFCQNHRIAHVGKELEPWGGRKYVWFDDKHDRDPAALAEQYDTKGIAFTYNEPTVHYAEILRVSERAKPSRHIVVKSNGFATSYVWKRLAKAVDAYNIDIKGPESVYQKLGGRLKPVLSSIEMILSLGHHLEISYFVHPEALSKRSFHRDVARWLGRLDKRIPVHVLYAYPSHDLEHSYKPEELDPVFGEFSAHLDFVYFSNLFSENFRSKRNTYCPSCKSLMVSRQRSIEVLKPICCGKRAF